MFNRPLFTRIVQSLEPTVPFIAPEALERRSGRQIKLRLGANESAFGISPHARVAMRQAIDRLAWYCDPESYELRWELARIHKVGMQNLVVGSGIDDLLGLIVRTFVAPGDTVVTSLGAYPTFNYHALGYGGNLHRVPYRNDHNDLGALASAAKSLRARLVYLANPDNPTGTWHTTVDLQAFIQELPSTCLLVLDEAYIEFMPLEAYLPLNASAPQVIRLRTFSKAHGLAGARVGYAIAEAETIAAFDKIRLHFGVNRIAQAGALASLHDKDFLQQVINGVAQGRREYEELSRELGFSSLPSATNFVAIDVGNSERARALVNKLFDQGTFVRMPGVPPLDRCIRVTVGLPEERSAFAELLRRTIHLV
jgi:histidinol-phosphate aminotransferase